ncbi:ras-domain-containing protein [Meredithblackwellia eburnea MCA 4105]
MQGSRGLAVYSSTSNNNSRPLEWSPNSQASTQSTAASYYSNSSPNPQILRPNAKVKLCCVGDGGVGKTCLLIVYSENRFPTDYVPTVFENYVINLPYGDHKLVEFALWDTAGQEEYDRLRPLSYPESDVLLVCFAIDYPPSLDNVLDKWYPEVAHFCEGVPILLVATKTDLRSDQRTLDLLKAQGRKPVSPQEGADVARRIGARYMEVSAKTGRGVQEVFELALKEGMKGGHNQVLGKIRKGKCVVL